MKRKLTEFEKGNIRTGTGMSQSAFASKYGIPVRTLQEWEQGRAMPNSLVSKAIQEKVERDAYIDIEKYRFVPKKTFPVVINETFKNIEQIHPIMQKRVKMMIDELSKDNNVQSAIVFGSSVTNHCSSESDIDIYVEINKEKEVPVAAIDCGLDLWTNFSVVSKMFDEIKKTGVIVYERRN